MCQCLPGFGGPECEKLLSVNFVDRDTYLQFTDLQNWPRANITLQVRAQGARSQSGVGQVRAAKGLPAWENGEEPVLIKTLWMWVQQMWKGYWVTKAIFDRGKREGWKWSRVTGSCPATCLTCPPEPASHAAHTPGPGARPELALGFSSGLVSSASWPRGLYLSISHLEFHL